MADNAARTEQDYRPLRAAPLPVPSGTGRVLTAVTDTTSLSGYRLIWDNGLAAVGALTALTNSTGVTPDNTIANVPGITVAAHTDLALTDTQIDDTPDATAVNLAINAAITDAVAKVKTGVDTELAGIEDSLADLAGKINEIIAAAAI